MLACKDVRKILINNVKPNTSIDVSTIYSIVETNYILTNADLVPYTKSRKTNYPRWKHQVDNELQSLKKRGKASSITGNYTFY